ncbi:MAG: FkbM family methyltransferase [Lewinellaceae bacterium]|nr:FkbM family methyltransferase [Lewinellaceae bacterium]
MLPVFEKVYRKFRKWTEGDLKINIDTRVPVERFGTHYGGWIIPKNFLHADSVCYLVGAGEDVSFDLEIAHRFGCTVDIFDPTPRAVQHVEKLIASLKNGEPMACATSPGGFYPPYPTELADRLRLHPFGIWDKDGTLNFFTPENQAHVSHSLVNLQKSDASIQVPVRTLQSVLDDLGHQHIDLLKLDVEGAEYQILNAVLSAKIPIGVLCVEYDETANNHLDKHYMARISNSIDALTAAGYRVIAQEPDCRNFTFLHESVTLSKDQ